ncbi:MAG TPA: TerB family tellurite resistance protein [Acidimicrobiales bacterium]
MLLIWGLRVRMRVLMRDVFFCPSCGGDRWYARKQGRRWFTFFFLPIIPLGHVGEELVECETCHHAYTTGVLQTPTTAVLGDTLVTATREAVVWLLRISAPGPAAVRAALDVLSATGNVAWDERVLRADVAGLEVGGLGQRLATLSTVLNDHGRERFLAGCTRVALADGPPSPDERSVLDHIAASLGMSPAHARGVTSQVADQVGLAGA